MDLNIVTANVLALDPVRENSQGRAVATRTVRLDSQWHQGSVAIVGVQEARTTAGVHYSPNFAIYASGADFTHTASLGCEIWIHQRLPLWYDQQGRAFSWSTSRTVVLHADPRRLVLQLAWGPFRLHVVALHAPYVGGRHSLQEVQHWWTATTELLGTLGSTPMIICVDANAPLGTPATDGVGVHGAEDSTSATLPFVQMITELQLWVPATFSHCHRGPSWTWTHPRGHRRRRDYILLNHFTREWKATSWTCFDHDTTFTHEDHVPAAVHLRGPFSCPGLQDLAPPQRWDPEAFKNPAQCRAFQEALLSLPLPTWHVKPQDHCQLWEKQLLSLGQQFFAAKPTKTKRLRLPEAARNMIAFKRQVLDYERATTDAPDPAMRNVMKDMERLIRPHVRRAQTEFYDKLLTQAQDANGQMDSKEMFKVLLRLGRQSARRGGPRPLPALQRPDGSLAATFEEQQQIWFRQFESIEAGFTVTWEALQVMNGTGPTLALRQLEPDLFPSDWSVMRCIRTTKSGKVPGPNGIPPELLKAGGPVLARQLALLTTKVVATAKEPLQWKGGRICPLYKGRGSAQEPDSYRSIFISDYTAKIFHRTLRTHLATLWESHIQALQAGGRARYATDVAHHFVQAHGQWARHRKLRAATLFFDVKNAFYSVFRQAVVDAPLDPDRLPFALAKHGLLPPNLDAMLTELSKDASQFGMPEHLTAILQDLLHNTHFYLPSLPTPCVTTRGTRPGDPVGDILYNLIMTRILEDMRIMVENEEEAVWFGVGNPHEDFTTTVDLPTFGFGELAFVDDCAVLIHAPDNDRLMRATACIAKAFAVAAAKRGLQINWKEGKTELLWRPDGTGARQLRQDFATKGAFVPAEPGESPPTLRVVDSYKHLGTWMQTRGLHSREVGARISAARSGWGPLARSFYSRKAVSSTTKVMVFRMVTGARHLFHAHVWTGIKDQDLQCWAAALRPMLATLARGLLRGLPHYSFSVELLAGMVGLLPPDAALHLARLRYLHRFFKLCPPALWTMLWEDTSACSWLSRCRQSLAWFCYHYDHPLPLDPDRPLVEWIQFIQLDGNWKGRLRTAATACVHFFRAKADHALHIALFDREFARLGAQLPDLDPPSDPRPWQCGLCEARFAHSKGLAVHSYKCHGYRDRVRYFALGSTCLACNQCFHSRPRLCRHLQTQTHCMDQYQACFAPASEEEVDLLDEMDRTHQAERKAQGWTVFHALQACFRVPGAPLPPVDSAAARQMLEGSRARVNNPEPAYHHLYGYCTTSTTSSSALWWTEQDLPAFVFQSSGGPQRGDGRLDASGLARVHALLHIRCLVFVHFFSGYRRHGDLHQILEQHHLPKGEQLFVLSVDLCMQRQSGDLARPEALTWWKARAAAGQLIGCGGGPPCETYTAARWQDLDGPRPLRDAAHPWGRPGLSGKEWMQLTIGTKLMHFLLMMTLTTVQTGGCAFVEHPQWPVWQPAHQVASIWGARQMRLLRTLACVTITSFDQCIFAARARKPTTFLTVRLPGFRRRCLTTGFGGRCAHPTGFHRALRGREGDGRFRTAAHKIYPEGLNQALGAAILEFVCGLAAEQEFRRALAAAFEPYQQMVFADLDEVQPDYHGQG
eukprot:Skav200304  [mRNA]  locus=scaffold4329:95264:100090:- [translate_table: standard]